MDNDVTKKYYHDNSTEYFASAIDADMIELYEHFLKHIPSGGKILDFGCGSGRDANRTIIVDVHRVDMKNYQSERMISIYDWARVNGYDDA